MVLLNSARDHVHPLLPNLLFPDPLGLAAVDIIIDVGPLPNNKYIYMFKGEICFNLNLSNELSIYLFMGIQGYDKKEES